MNVLKFEVRYADGRKEIMVVEAQRALVGSGAHCDVRLPLDQAAAEHVLVEVAGSSVRVEARATDPVTTLGGAPYEVAEIAPDMPLAVGNVQLFVALVDPALLGPGATHMKGKGTEMSPLLKVAALVIIPLGVYALLADQGGGVAPPPVQLPEIFEAKVEVCPQAAPDRAAAVAHERRLQAEGKRERSPFVPQEGIAAVGLFETAAACYKVAGKANAARDNAHAAQALRTAITADFRARRVRLEHSLVVEDWELSKRDVRVLRAITEGRRGDYVTWLGNIHQQLKQQTGGGE